MIGPRLVRIRGPESQAEFATRMGVHKNTYARWERNERELAASNLAALVEMGWNANWILTGQGPERLDSPGVGEEAGRYGSQVLSEEAFTIALGITDDIIRDEGARYVPRVLYARLLRLMLQGITQGLPSADVYDVGRGTLRELTSAKGTGESDDGKQAMGGTGQGGRR